MESSVNEMELGSRNRQSERQADTKRDAARQAWNTDTVIDIVAVRHGVTSSARTWMNQRGEKREREM